MNSYLSHFSCGAASFAATKIALDTYGKAVKIYNIYLVNEHPDNDRFRADANKFFQDNYGVTINVVKDTNFGSDINQVFDQLRYLRGMRGARCTIELKKKVRYTYEDPEDIHIFGYGSNEKKRAERAIENSPEYKFWFPLIEHNISSKEARKIITHCGIRLPIMYELGFNNNNCIGCVKAQSPKYWLRVKRLFPEEFKKRARQERELNFALCKWRGKTIFLDELKESDFPKYAEEIEEDLSCGFNCGE